MNKPSLQQKQTLFFVRSSFHCRNKTKRPETAMNYNTFFPLALNETAWHQTMFIVIKGIHQNQGSFLLVQKFRYFLLEECRILGFGISICLKESEIILIELPLKPVPGIWNSWLQFRIQDCLGFPYIGWMMTFINTSDILSKGAFLNPC